MEQYVVTVIRTITLKVSAEEELRLSRVEPVNKRVPSLIPYVS